MIDPMVPIGRFQRQIQEYKPEDVVLQCAAISRYMDNNQELMLHVPFPETIAGFPHIRNAIVTHHGLAAVTRLAIRNYRWAKGRRKAASWRDVVVLANNWTNVEDPFLGSGIMTLVRSAYEQFPYQEEARHLIPRYLTIFTETHPEDPPLDVPGEFLSKVGLSIEEFMQIGLAFYSAGRAHVTFPRSYLEDTKSERLQPLLTREKIDAFLHFAAADFPAFRDLCLQEESEVSGAGKWVFNSLISRPIVILPDGTFCIPILKLLIHRITIGIYYDLMKAFSDPIHNRFLDWFGHAFEEYGGIILRRAFDPSVVNPETAYGSPQKRGPDWTLLDQKIGLALEFRSSRLPKSVRTRTERDQVLDRVRQGLANTASRLPGKVQDILDGSAGLNASGTSEIIPGIVTVEPWYPVALTYDLIQEELRKEGRDPVRFQLMTIGDLEWLLTWSRHESPGVVLRDKLSDPTQGHLSVSQYLSNRAKDQGRSFPPHILKDKSEAFFDQIIGPDDQGGEGIAP